MEYFKERKTLQSYKVASNLIIKRMAEFVVNFDLLGGLTFDEWWETIDRMEEKELKKTRHAEKTEAEIEALAKARNEAGTIKHTVKPDKLTLLKKIVET